MSTRKKANITEVETTDDESDNDEVYKGNEVGFCVG